MIYVDYGISSSLFNFPETGGSYSALRCFALALFIEATTY